MYAKLSAYQFTSKSNNKSCYKDWLEKLEKSCKCVVTKKEKNCKRSRRGKNCDDSEDCSGGSDYESDGIKGYCPIGCYNKNPDALGLDKDAAEDLLANPTLLQYVCAVGDDLTKEKKGVKVDCAPIPGYVGPKFNPCKKND